MCSCWTISAASASVPSSGKSAVAEVVAAGAIVDEAHHLIPQLAMLQDFLRDHAPQVAGARNQDALEADARFPAPLQHFAHQLARAERERHVEDQEQAPDHARDFIRAAVLQLRRHVVGLERQRRDDAQHHGHDAADEHGEEIVHARAAAPQAVQALKLIPQRHQHGDERQHRHVLLERRIALDDGNEAAGKPDEVRKAEGDDAQNGVGDNVRGHQQAVVSSKHERSRSESIGQTPRCRTESRARESPLDRISSAWPAGCRPRRLPRWAHSPARR